ncbi:hypothetical protein, partial [Paracraurococcus lichenis]
MSGSEATGRDEAVVEADALRQLRATVRGVPQLAPSTSGLMLGGVTSSATTHPAPTEGAGSEELDRIGGPERPAADTTMRLVETVDGEGIAIGELLLERPELGGTRATIGNIPQRHAGEASPIATMPVAQAMAPEVATAAHLEAGRFDAVAVPGVGPMPPEPVRHAAPSAPREAAAAGQSATTVAAGLQEALAPPAVVPTAVPEAIPLHPVVHAAAVTGDEDTAIRLDLSAALTDTDGSEALSVTLLGVPAGATLSAG